MEETTELQENGDPEGNTYFDENEEGRGGDDGGDERKIFLTRIPTKFDADTITRLFELSFEEGCVEHIALPSSEMTMMKMVIEMVNQQVVEMVRTQIEESI